MAAWHHLLSEAMRNEFLLMIMLYVVAFFSWMLWYCSFCIPCCGRMIRPLFFLLGLLTIVSAIGTTLHALPIARTLARASFNAGEALVMEQLQQQYRQQRWFNQQQEPSSSSE
jgi:hypothetical protein